MSGTLEATIAGIRSGVGKTGMIMGSSGACAEWAASRGRDRSVGYERDA